MIGDFGAKILLSSLIDTIYEQIYSLTIGKKYSSSQLSFFNKGQAFPRFIVINIDSSIESVMLPTYSRCQHNRNELKKVMRNTIMLSSYFVFPLLALLFCMAESVVLLVLSAEWMECAIYVRIFCLSLMLHPINTANLQAINATGRSGVVLKINIFKKLFALIVLILTIPHGVFAIGLGTIINGFMFAAANVYPNSTFMNYKLHAQIWDVLPNLIMAILMGIVVFPVNIITLPPLLKICLQMVIGMSVYIIFSHISRNKAFEIIKIQCLNFMGGK